ncbi:hypothetical protein RJT34_11163 [Clitoria ternatea]|uniref:Uncharacterized protein n=1 Tax=Clitoria ternatea TaxID=43366 RepID=A0AAN9PI70_CLITE
MRAKGAYSVTFTFKNNCPFTVWPATLTGGSKPQLSTTGFELPSKSSFSLTVPDGWSGRFWGRSQCFKEPTGKFTCEVADCGSEQISCNGEGEIPPASLVELTLSSNTNDQDFCDISLVDGIDTRRGYWRVQHHYLPCQC